jgi:hypothetical protein
MLYAALKGRSSTPGLPLFHPRLPLFRLGAYECGIGEWFFSEKNLVKWVNRDQVAQVIVRMGNINFNFFPVYP